MFFAFLPLRSLEGSRLSRGFSSDEPCHGHAVRQTRAASWVACGDLAVSPEKSRDERRGKKRERERENAKSSLGFGEEAALVSSFSPANLCRASTHA